ncbi:DUF3116 family protein [Listeria ivanovii]|uniref:DUF3116 family protein n=1 Tax=Listeria ivanovii TaxID=1638 RepID=UPI0003EC9F11|nr:DUF3116 family protein [Listeria ivanovii]AHI57015.1 hypothetical protein AX25_13365 [Listeria ivanovii WSLC3009]AIS66428.1 hypothetical protein JL52_13165 [Listeria ivanovii subsp. ivanovii]MBC1759769.1 DUF3116 family protein [Listeria ivanovii]PZG51107.1 hypothetical protein C1909_11320 [Listeria ivanovii]QDA71003.1 hypothetical protein EOS99_01775 [Listeria ivanovii]
MLPEREIIYSILVMFKDKSERIFDLAKKENIIITGKYKITKNKLIYTIYWLEGNGFLARKNNSDGLTRLSQKYCLTELGKEFISFYDSVE